jgi:hypothetical protein
MNDNCPNCPHQAHPGRICGGYITRTIRDDVGIFAKPTGISRTIIDRTCNCGSRVEQAASIHWRDTTVDWHKAMEEEKLYGYSETLDEWYRQQGITIVHEKPELT